MGCERIAACMGTLRAQAGIGGGRRRAARSRRASGRAGATGGPSAARLRSAPPSPAPSAASATARHRRPSPAPAAPARRTLAAGAAAGGCASGRDPGGEADEARPEVVQTPPDQDDDRPGQKPACDARGRGAAQQIDDAGEALGRGAEGGGEHERKRNMKGRAGQRACLRRRCRSTVLHQGCAAIQAITSAASSCSWATYSPASRQSFSRIFAPLGLPNILTCNALAPVTFD